MGPLDEAIAERLRSLRKRSGKTQKWVAERLSISVGQFSKYESGQNRLTVARLSELAEVFGVTMDALIVGGAAPVGEAIVAADVDDALGQAVEILAAFRTISCPRLRRKIVAMVQLLALDSSDAVSE